MKFKKFIKYYLWIGIVLLPACIVFELIDDESFGIVDFLDYAFCVVAIVGMWGFSYGKDILVQQFWKVFSIFIIAWDVFVAFDTISSDPEYHKPFFIVFFLIVYLIIVLPEYVSLYLYGFKRKES